MASSSVASTSSAASSSFNRLLKSSKVLSQYDPTLPLVYTSHGGSAKRSDFGLKRPLPKLKTQAIRVKQLDSPTTKLTDFDYAARDYTFVKRFQELGVGVAGPEADTRLRGVAEERGGCHWDADGFQSIEKLRQMAGRAAAAKKESTSRVQQVQQALTGVEVQGGDSDSAQPSSLRIKYLDMTAVQFEAFLSELRSLRPQYKEHLRQRVQASGNSPNVDDGLLAQQLRAQAVQGGYFMGETIEEFLAHYFARSPIVQSTASNIKPQPHYQKGLSYSAPTVYQTDVVAPPVPARLVATANYGDAIKGYGDSGKPAVVMGTTTGMRSAQLGATLPTSFMLDSQGEYNVEMGKISGGVRVDSVTLREQDVREQRVARNNKGGDGDDFEAADAGSDSKTLLDENPVLLTAHGAHGENSFVRFRQIDHRIGSRNWVARSHERPSYASMEEEMLFNLPDNISSASGQYKVAPPRPNEFSAKSDSIRGQKARTQTSQGKNQKSEAADSDSVNDLLNTFAAWKTAKTGKK